MQMNCEFELPFSNLEESCFYSICFLLRLQKWKSALSFSDFYIFDPPPHAPVEPVEPGVLGLIRLLCLAVAQSGCPNWTLVQGRQPSIVIKAKAIIL